MLVYCVCFWTGCTRSFCGSSGCVPFVCCVFLHVRDVCLACSPTVGSTSSYSNKFENDCKEREWKINENERPRKLNQCTTTHRADAVFHLKIVTDAYANSSHSERSLSSTVKTMDLCSLFTLFIVSYTIEWQQNGKFWTVKNEFNSSSSHWLSLISSDCF